MSSVAHIFTRAAACAGACLLATAAATAFAEDGPGASYDAIWTVHAMDNAAGGLKQGSQAISRLDGTGDWQIDDHWTAHADVAITSNDGFSERYVGDTQVASNIDLPQGVHLAEAWLSRTSSGGRFTTTFGFIDVNDNFDVQDAGGLFLNSSHGVGVDLSQSGASAMPVTALAVVQEWRPRDDVRLRGAVFDGVAGDPDHPGAFVTARLSDNDGVQYLLEAEKDFDGGFVKLGHWGNSIKADAIDGSGAPQKYSGTYGQALVTLCKEAGDDAQGLQAWVRLGVARASVLPVDAYAGGGLVYTGPFPGRDHDQVGLGIASAHFGTPYRAITPDTTARETTVEATYQYEVKPGFIVQPDVQYVRHPSGLTTVKDALVIGVQVRVSLAELLG